MLDVIAAASSVNATRVAVIELALDPAAHRYRRSASFTYGELAARAARMADLWAAFGLARGARVAVLLDNGADMVASEWSCILSGRIWVALNVRSSAAENAAILSDAAPSVVLVAPGHREALEGALPDGTAILETGEAFDRALASASPDASRRPAAPGEPVRIRYTSGTAGKPKGAVLSRDGYDASLATVAEVLGPLHAEDAVVQAAPMTHASGAMFAPHAAVGARALALDRFDAAAFVALVEEERATATFLVPTMLVRVLDELGGQAGRLPSLRAIVYGGAAMPADRLERGLALLGPVFLGIYGLTESTWPVTALSREDHQPAGGAEDRRRRLASCGRPTSVGELRIVDEEGREVPDATLGEILVRGRNTMLGYWDRARGGPGPAGAEDRKGLDGDGWMHTGDLGRRDTDGFVTIVDRLHDMIVSGGFNVYPREVEEALSSHPAVLEAAVVGRPHPEWGETVHAAVVLRRGRNVDAGALADHCARLTADYKKPRSIDFVEELPRNSSGKILRRALRADG